jgi:hypothetical protein
LSVGGSVDSPSESLETGSVETPPVVATSLPRNPDLGSSEIRLKKSILEAQSKQLEQEMSAIKFQQEKLQQQQLSDASFFKLSVELPCNSSGAGSSSSSSQGGSSSGSFSPSNFFQSSPVEPVPVVDAVVEKKSSSNKKKKNKKKKNNKTIIYNNNNNNPLVGGGLDLVGADVEEDNNQRVGGKVVVKESVPLSVPLDTSLDVLGDNQPHCDHVHVDSASGKFFFFFFLRNFPCHFFLIFL